MADQLFFSPIRALDSNGDPVAGALAYFYQTGTTTPVVIYSDATNETPMANPLTADAAGLFPQVFPSPGQQIKVVVTDPDDTVLPGFPIDPAPLHSTGGSSAARVSFSPVVSIPEMNVQDAIEQVQANLAADIEARATDAGRALMTAADAAAQRTALGLKALATLDPTGTPDATTFLRGDGAWSGVATRSAVVATTSGTAFDFTGIPAWANEITITFAGVGFSAGDILIVQLLDAAGAPIAAGYTSVSATVDALSLIHI